MYLKPKDLASIVSAVVAKDLASVAKVINGFTGNEIFTPEKLAELNTQQVSTTTDNSTSENIDDADSNSSYFTALDFTALTKTAKSALVSVPSREEARYISDIYYQVQAMRLAVEGQLRAMAQGVDQDSDIVKDNKTISVPVQSKPFMEWYHDNLLLMEQQIKKALSVFADSTYMGKWAGANLGIGPTIATQLVAYLDIPSETGFYAGNWWSYCGLNDNNRPWLGREKSAAIINRIIKDPKHITDSEVMQIASETKWRYSYFEENAKTESGSWSKDLLIKASAKVPYNQHMKVLMYKIGHQFHLVKGRDSLYGKVFTERLDYEISKNENGEYKEQAANILRTKNIGKDTKAYQAYSNGKLPIAQLNQRAERYATKLFISHLFEAEYYNKFGKQAPNPYMLAVQGHKGYIAPQIPYDRFERDGI